MPLQKISSALKSAISIYPFRPYYTHTVLVIIVFIRYVLKIYYYYITRLIFVISPSIFVSVVVIQ